MAYKPWNRLGSPHPGTLSSSGSTQAPQPKDELPGRWDWATEISPSAGLACPCGPRDSGNGSQPSQVQPRRWWEAEALCLLWNKNLLEVELTQLWEYLGKKRPGRGMTGLEEKSLISPPEVLVKAGWGFQGNLRSLAQPGAEVYEIRDLCIATSSVNPQPSIWWKCLDTKSSSWECRQARHICACLSTFQISHNPLFWPTVIYN